MVEQKKAAELLAREAVVSFTDPDVDDERWLAGAIAKLERAARADEREQLRKLWTANPLCTLDELIAMRERAEKGDGNG